MKPSSVLGLPESGWVWRRAIVWAVTFGLWGLLALAISRAPTAAMEAIAAGLMKLLALVLVLYLVAPSAQQLVELLAALRLRLRVIGR